MVLQGHLTNENHYISTTRLPITTKFDRMVTYLDGLLLKKLKDPLFLWSYEITWQKNPIISPLSLCLFQPYVVGWWLTLRGPNHKVVWHFNHVVMQGRVTKENYYTSITRVLIVTQLGRRVTYLEGLLNIKSFIALIAWF